MTSLLVGVGIVAAVYAGLCAFLYFKQEQMLFYPVTTDAQLAKQWESRRVVIRTVATEIEGWWAENASADNDLAILYFGGNAEDVLFGAAEAHRFHARGFLVTNYRGYGRTPGKPSQENLFMDAVAVYDYLIAKRGVAAQNIVVMGRSLGSGVATYVASKRSVRAAILVTPYDNIASVAQAHYPYFPVSWLLKHRFPSAELAANLHVPALLLAAEHDDVVPGPHTARLLDAWAGPKTLLTIPGTGHNDIDQANAYTASINAFLDSLREKG